MIFLENIYPNFTSPMIIYICHTYPADTVETHFYLCPFGGARKDLVINFCLIFPHIVMDIIKSESWLLS